MADIVFPTTREVQPNSFTLGVKRFDLTFESALSGHTEARILAPARWTVSMSFPPRRFRQADNLTALIDSLEGKVNTLRLYPCHRPIPLGTYRGAPVAVGITPAGASTLTMVDVTQGTATLVAGDFVGVHQGTVNEQLLRITEASMAVAGQITITFANRLRTELPAASAVTMTYPRARFKLTGNESTVNYEPMIASGFSLDLIESIGL